MTTTPQTAPAARTENPVTKTEAYSLQLNAAATDLTVLDLDVLGRYCIQISDTAFIYLDTDGLTALVEQGVRVLNGATTVDVPGFEGTRSALDALGTDNS